ncbi:MAG: hypothetical protein OXF27_21105 [Acidobacteria bacterium]|nr:hypothetical protein [Acidobacteriota bacterium]
MKPFVVFPTADPEVEAVSQLAILLHVELVEGFASIDILVLTALQKDNCPSV